MRIAVYHNLPSGGAKRSLYESVKRLSQRHSLDVYTLDTSDMEYCSLEEYRAAEYVYHFSPSRLFRSPLGRFNQVQRWRDLKRLDRLAHSISSIIDAGRYDLVFAQPCMWTQAPLVLRYLQTPTLYYCHEPPRHIYENHLAGVEQGRRLQSILNHVDPLIRLYQNAGRDLDKSATQAAKLVLVNSRFIRERVREIYGIEPVINYQGVDTDMFCPGQRIEDKCYVLSVGAIQPHKGYDFLIESIGAIDKKVRPPLHLVGNMENPSERERLEALAVEKGVDLSIEVGINLASLIRKYREARLVVYAPYDEPFGLVPLEAMACGKPVVGVNEGGVKETVVHNSTGILMERNAQKFGESIEFLLNSPDLIEQYGRNGRTHAVKNWSWEKSVAELEQRMYQIIQ